ncbi:retinal pigment epithelial membrane family [Fusarium sp. NRRL 52700]|nr:retinal pigment epithelial membrane family [Fusarium sp. NRRL 52700]
MLQVLNGKILETKRMLNLTAIDPELNGFGTCSRNLKDRNKSEEYNYLNNPQTGVLSVLALDIESNPTKMPWKTSIPCRPCYVHSMAMSSNYVISICNPISMDLSDTTKPFSQSKIYEPQSPTEIFVIDKITGKHYFYGILGHGRPSPGTSVSIGRLGNGFESGTLQFSQARYQVRLENWNRPDATDEDDGIILTIVINREATHSVLVAIDTKTFKEVARSDMPQVYALGPHGTFIEGEFGI